MNIYKISQNVNNNYDTYDSAVVLAESEEEARGIHPSQSHTKEESDYFLEFITEWTTREKVKVELIGKTNKKLKSTDNPVICASFNAG